MTFKALFCAIKSQFLSLTYPIGAIYMSANSTNPASLFGGTWEAWGAGRVPVGIGSNGETNYTAVETVGGSENSVATHTHAQAAHTHTQNSHRHTLISASNYSTNCNGLTGYNSTQVGGIANSSGTEVYCDISSSSNNSLGSNQPYVHNTTAVNNATTATNTATGSAGGNRQPFITCYMWKRKA